MAGKSTISITFKLDGDSKGFKDLAKDAEGLKTVISNTVSQAQQLKGNVINFAALATGIDAAQRSFNQLQSGMQDLANAYAIQETAERKLETVMQQRMNATKEDVQSIKDLCSAQQELGVIGDEVQLSGAQQMATFLNSKKSIDTLLPAMNNLLAQQKGLNATGEDARNIGNLMGKVMQGQTAALTRVGITFTEAEGKVLKYGTESERAAMLAQVITNNVGNMNAELAQTDSGKQQQLANTIGDIKEQIGGMVNGALPFVTIAAQSSTALAAISTLVAGIKTLSTTLYASTKAFAVSTFALIKNKGAILAAAAAQKIVATATAVWTGVQKILNLVLTANPIGLVIAAIGAMVAAVVYAYNNCEAFRNIVDKLWNAIKPLANAIMNGLAKAFEWLCEKAKEAWEWLKNILGLGGKKVDVAVNVSKPKNSPELKALEDKYSNYKPTATGGGTGKVKTPTIKTTTEKDNAPLWNDEAKNLQEITDNIEILRNKLQTASVEEAAGLNQQIKLWETKADAIRNAGEVMESNGPVWNESANTLKGIGDNITILTDQLQNATVSEASAINKQIDLWNEKAEAIKNAGREEQKQTIKTGEALQRSWGGIKTIGGSIEGITNALRGNGNAWQMVTGIVDGFISLYNGISTVVGIIHLLTAASAAHAVTKGVEATAETAEAATRVAATGNNAGATTAQIIDNKLETASWRELAAAKYMAAHAEIPFAGFGIAAGFTAAMEATVTAAGIPMLADGGVATGPTLAMVGEYAGASANPEIIAPLDKLKNMIADTTGGGISGEVEFKIKGRTLVGILSKETNIINRS